MQPVEMSVPLDLADKTRVGQVWSRGNHMALFNRAVGQSQRTTSSSQLLEVCWNVSFFDNKYSRALVSESAQVFKNVQLVKKTDRFQRQDLVKASRKYRSVVHSCYSKLRSRQNDEEALRLSNMFYQIEVVWNLCEILYMDIHATGQLLNQMLTWIRWHFTSVVRKAEEVVETEEPSIHPNYWDVIILYICRGELETARRFLELHPDYGSQEELTLLSDLLAKMPQNSPHLLLHEFYLRWQSWHDECERLLRQGAFCINPKIELIAQLLCGEPDAFIEVSQCFESWCQMLVAILLFTDPCIKEKNLANLALECGEQFFGDNRSQISPFDELLVSAFSYDLMQVIQKSCACFNDNWWFATHFIDLMYNADLLNDDQVEKPDRFREFFVVDYANNLITHQSLWNFGIDYLEHCLELGLEQIELNLQHVPISSDAQAQRIIDIARRHNLVFLSRSISKVNARRWFSKNKLGSALSWAVRSEDPALTTAIADKFLDTYFKDGVFPDEDVLSNLGSSMFTSDRLTFLAKYYEFHLQTKQGKLKPAAEILVSLLSSRLSPRFFIKTLLVDSIPLLEAPNLVMDAKQTNQLLSSLEEFVTEQKNLDSFKEFEPILRLAVARNLARAFLALNTN